MWSISLLLPQERALTPSSSTLLFAHQGGGHWLQSAPLHAPSEGQLSGGLKTDRSSGHSGGTPKHGVFNWLIDMYAVAPFRC